MGQASCFNYPFTSAPHDEVVTTTSTAFIPLLLGAVADQEAGRLGKAFAGFAEVLAHDPEQPQALLFAGVLALRMGEPDRALLLLERAVAVRPTIAETHFAHGNALWALERRSAARASWQHAIRFDAQHIGALLNLAQAQERSGEAELAVSNCRAAVDARPDYPQPWTALSSALRGAGKTEEALDAANNALRAHPTFAMAHYQRGMALKLLSRTAEAADALRQAIINQPESAPSHLSLANLLHDLGDLDGAENECCTAIALSPMMAEAHTVLGFLLTQRCDLPGAIACCDIAIGIAPDLTEAHCNLGVALLTTGDLPAGFAQYEWRKRHSLAGKDFFPQTYPEWSGQPLAGKRIVIMAEQGLGDAIMFARYAGMLASRGATVSIACDRRLVSLLDSAPGVTTAIPKTREMPGFDFWVDQMSLPLICKTTLTTIPHPTAYLAADPQRADRWASRLTFPEGHRRIGLAWAGNPLHTNDANRSCPLRVLETIVDLPGLTCISLQVGDSAGQAAALGMHDWSHHLTDYAETAALIANLDLVITVDTSVAHLAAALGKPTWIMLPHCPEWRWLHTRTDTPWYETVRLFRQSKPGDWDSVRDEIIAAL